LSKKNNNLGKKKERGGEGNKKFQPGKPVCEPLKKEKGRGGRDALD